MKTFSRLVCLMLLGIIGANAAAEFPQAEISNGLIKAKLALPDPEKGFYRGTRFDWSGLIFSLEYKGRTYFGPWFKSHDPKVTDIEFRASLSGFAVGTPSASMGPVEEFSTPVGYDEAAAQSTFIKIGVGVLRKPLEERYAWYTRYEIADPGKWTLRKASDSIEFVQEISGPAGYAYVYRKTVRLSKDKPGLVLEHSLKNSGKRKIETSVYNHNFLVMDDQPSGPDFVIKVPFEIEPARDTHGIMEARGKEIVFLREPKEDERAMISVTGFSNRSTDYDIRVENRKTGAGVRITADRPLARMAVWAIRPTRCPEPFIDIQVDPGMEFRWRIVYEFYQTS